VRTTLHRDILSRARSLLLNEDLEGAFKELERVDESATAEIIQEKL